MATLGISSESVYLQESKTYFLSEMQYMDSCSTAD